MTHQLTPFIFFELMIWPSPGAFLLGVFAAEMFYKILKRSNARAAAEREKQNGKA